VKSEHPDVGTSLMLDFQAGNESAFDELVLAHQGMAFAVLRRVIGPNATIEDLAQEAFIRVYRARESYVPKGKFSTWFYRILFNLGLNEIRRNKRKPLYSMPKNDEGVEVEHVDHAAEAPSQGTHDADWSDLVGAALAKIPENQRCALVLQHYEGLDLTQIAEVLSISTKATKSLLHRARESMRHILAPQRDAEND